MKKHIISLLIFALSLPSLTHAEGLLIYKPPKTGAPTSRIGGGTRGLSLETPKIKVLAPSHTALTSQSQPTLYWYLFEPTAQAVELTLTKEGDDTPVIEKQLPPIAQAGLQAVHLTDYGAFLQTGQKYRWSVALIDDKGQASPATVANASIRYELFGNPSASVEEKAQAGYWYDALEQLVESHSAGVNELLKQVDIDISPI